MCLFGKVIIRSAYYDCLGNYYAILLIFVKFLAAPKNEIRLPGSRNQNGSQRAEEFYHLSAATLRQTVVSWGAPKIVVQRYLWALVIINRRKRGKRRYWGLLEHLFCV